MAELANEFGFSYSRHRTFYSCPRKLYWQYYGFWGGWLPEASRESALAYRLKQLKNLTMVVGETFHRELAEILRRRSDRPSGVPVQQLKDDMERRLLKRLRESRNADWANNGDVKNHAMLFEDYYGSGVSAEREAEAIATLHRCVEGLAANPFGRRVFAVSTDKLRMIDPEDVSEKRVPFDGLALYASPDLVVEGKDGGLHIVDWKTGGVTKTDLTQLAVYGLFVQHKFGQPLERMTAHVIYVGAGAHERVGNIGEGVEEAKREIATFCEDVRSRLTDVDKNIAGDIERFPMTKDRRLCRTCKFRELCNRMED